IVELQRETAFRPDAAAPRLDELAVLREADEAIVAAARRVHVVFERTDAVATVAIGDPDVAVLRHDHAGGPVEMLVVGAGHARFAKRHHQLAVTAELVDLMPEVFLEPGVAARIAVGRAVGHPDEPFTIDEEAVREVHDPFAEAPHELAVHIDFDDRIEYGLGAAVRAAAIEDPDVLTVGIDPDAAGHTDL